MKVRIIRAIDDFEINIRYTDEIAEDLGMSDHELLAMEDELQRFDRFWIDAGDTFVKPL